ncbi:sulfatase [Gramella sp. MAR_2010_147]|uniref:sulfatase family protein n=1 Tax=Gramella sp. MAR_2010_147 TaxID=1250205 RepID=UPI00087978CB|nr:sulfatase [Gramella sp. MAR_2010_147]SDS64314.1 uncharacterized sulfatase [Gramella sp. MAR_2010_147]
MMNKINERLKGLKVKSVISVLCYLIFTHFISCNNNHTETDRVTKEKETIKNRPNILFAISDDQSFPHASIYGEEWINTPAFDRVAREGVLFTNAFSASPGCSPSRAAILTGMNPWQLEQAGTHDSEFPTEYTVFPDILEKMGYKVGYTGKGWGPGNWEASGRKRNPAGDLYNDRYTKPLLEHVSTTDYAGNFDAFLAERDQDRPFYFWYGSREPHRRFETGSGLESGRRLDEVKIPAFLPDSPEVRSDLLDYALEIEYFDQHLATMIAKLEEIGELENTIIVVTSDNGMSFPSAKANAYEYGTHVPLAIRWGNRVKGGRTLEDLVSLIDLAPTFLEAAAGSHSAGILKEYAMEGKSLISTLKNKNQEEEGAREAVFTSRERHSSSRWNNLTYPQRSIRTDDYLYIRNFKPERWPAGAPQKVGSDGKLEPMHGAYHDIDACPTFDFMVEHRNDPDVKPLFEKAVSKRPAEELFNIKNDPYCLVNLADDPKSQKMLVELRTALGGYLMQTNDPRVTGNGDIYETYKRYSAIRKFPDPDWLDENESNIPPLLNKTNNSGKLD